SRLTRPATRYQQLVARSWGSMRGIRADIPARRKCLRCDTEPRLMRRTLTVSAGERAKLGMNGEVLREESRLSEVSRVPRLTYGSPARRSHRRRARGVASDRPTVLDSRWQDRARPRREREATGRHGHPDQGAHERVTVRNDTGEEPSLSCPARL